MIVQQFNKKELARDPRPEIDKEAGTSGDGLGDFFAAKGKKGKKASIKNLRYMKDNDGTAAALYKLLRMPILANSWRIDTASDAPDAAKDAADRQALLVRNNFSLPPHKGGMTTPFRLVLSRTTKAVLEGYALAEKVLTVNSSNEIVYRKIAFRDPETITIIKDEKGGFAGYKQRYYSKSQKKMVEVEIPVEYCFLYTFNKDEDEIYGQSAFQAAYYHWDRKRRFYYLYEQAVEKGAMPPKMLEVLEGNNDTDDQKKSNLKSMTRFGIDSAVLIPTGYKMTPYEAGKGRLDPMPGIDHHDASSARSVLASFVLLGTQNDSSGGSFALSKSQSDLFLMALRGTMNEIEEHINSYLIPQLINYNFDTAYYPEFKFNDMSDDTTNFIESIFTEIVKKKDLQPSFVNGLVKQVAERLDIELDDDEEISDSDPVDDPELSKKKRNKKFAKWRRDLTEAEATVNLAAISDKMETEEQKFIDAMQPVYKQVTDKVLEDIKPIFDGGSLEDLDSLELGSVKDFEQVMIDSSLATYNSIKKITSDDLDVKIPSTPKESKDYFKQNAKSIREKQFSDLLFIVKTKVESEFHKGQLSKKKFGVEEVVTALTGEFDSFFESKIGITGSILVSQAVNRSRDDVFQTAEDDIAVYQYSAILDDKTCELCESLDGAIASPQDYKDSPFQPPIHQYCRCIWIAIKKDQSSIPAETGIPDISDEVVARNQSL